MQKWLKRNTKLKQLAHHLDDERVKYLVMHSHITLYYDSKRTETIPGNSIEDLSV